MRTNCTRPAAFLAAILWVFVLAETAWAVFGIHNRVEPLMDYVPQEVGIYDTTYWELNELDCRNCHGNSLVDRHHATDVVVLEGICTPCHDVLDEPPFVTVVRDCLTSGCHSWDDLETNGWHHNTDLSGSGACVACHDGNVIAEITPVRDFATYPPSITTPKPFSCENCHWGQDRIPGAGPDFPGHPSSFDHSDGTYQPGYFEYTRPIYGNMDTHHMAFQGNAPLQCYNCHGQDPNSPDWDPANGELIRYCETCHNYETLHNIDGHVSQTNGWEAAGFHVPLENTQTRDVDPTVYKTWEPLGPYASEVTDGFTAEQMCSGCHGEEVPSSSGQPLEFLGDVPEPPEEERVDASVPVIDNDAEGIEPKNIACGSVVTLRGTHFGDGIKKGRKVQVKLTGKENPWTKVPVLSWTNTRIAFELPCADFAPGNYKVRVKTETGKSNKVNVTIDGLAKLVSVAPEGGPCGTWITVSGVGFGHAQSEMFDDGYQGVHHVVDVVNDQGTFTVKRFEDWTDTSVMVRFKNFFQDTTDPETGSRNYVQNTGSGGYEEPTVRRCDGLDQGLWSLYVTTVYFGDEDQSGGLSPGDTIFRVLPSHPMDFTLTQEEDTTIIQSNALLETQGPAEMEDGPLFASVEANSPTEDGAGGTENQEADESDKGGCFLAVASGDSSSR